jgi:hypothetical protein
MNTPTADGRRAAARERLQQQMQGGAEAKREDPLTFKLKSISIKSIK